MKRLLLVLGAFTCMVASVKAQTVAYERNANGTYKGMYMMPTGFAAGTPTETTLQQVRDYIAAFRSDATGQDTGVYIKQKAGNRIRIVAFTDDGVATETTQAAIGTKIDSFRSDATSADTGLKVGPSTGATFPVSGSLGRSWSLSAATDTVHVESPVLIEGGNSTAVKVDGSGVTQPVSGTFWQATQPVSISSMPTTPVTGTFWQTTQPVSLSDKVMYDTHLDDKIPTETTITIEMTTAGTEYSYTTPANCIYWEMRPRSLGAWRYSTTSTGTNTGSYQTMSAGDRKTSLLLPHTLLASKTIYFQDPVNSGTYMEIEVHTR